MIVSLLLDGNAFIRVFRDEQGQVLNLVVLNPAKVDIQRNGLGRVMFRHEGEKSLLSTDEVLHIPDVVRPGHIRGTSRVDALKDNFGLAMALESYAARFFGQGVTMTGHIEFPGNLTPEQAKELSESFSARHGGFRKSHKVGILSAGAKFVSDQLDNDKSQFIDSRRMAVEDVARAFNIPPHLLGLPGTNTYASVEQNNIGFVTHTLRPIVSKMETALSTLLSTLPGGENAFIKFSMDGLLRGDSTSRFAAYSTGIQAGYLTVNDIRRLEDLFPIEGGDVLRVPLANINIDAADLVAEDKRVEMANKLIMSGFDPAEVLAAFELPAIKHTGVPSVQLQPLVNINPDDPAAQYEV
jgi:HK97 family phage portal protein